MKAITCYRIEHSDGYGLFSTKLWDESGNELGRREIYGSKDFPDLWARHVIGFKNPEQEGLLPNKDNKEYFCSFPSLTSVKYWIKQHHLQRIKELGFKVYELEVTDYQQGKFQVLYTKQSIINKLDITVGV